jgi:hypothetical protein
VHGRSRLGTLLVALPLATGGCVGTFRSPAQGGAQWIEVSSEHFFIQSDRSVDDAKSALQTFEAFRCALEKVAFPSASQPIGRTRVVLFEREDEYREIGPVDSNGFFSGDSFWSDPEPLAVLPQMCTSPYRVTTRS